MPQYLLSLHTVEGEARAPMTEEEMQQSWAQIGALNDELTRGAADAAASSRAEPASRAGTARRERA